MCALLSACGNRHPDNMLDAGYWEEDTVQKELLQGIWLDKEGTNPVFRIKGDSLFYPDSAAGRAYFFVRHDTMFVQVNGYEKYPIDTLTQYNMRFQSSMGETVQLEKSQSLDDTLYFLPTKPVVLTFNNVEKTDTVVFLAAERYHCYIYVNPTKHKVSKTSYTGEGLAVENVYNDNVIHICVYKGKNCLYSKDYSKKSFKGVVPDDFFSQAVLSNMTFESASAKGFVFHATLCVPDGATCYMVEILVSTRGNAEMNLIEY